MKHTSTPLQTNGTIPTDQIRWALTSSWTSTEPPYLPLLPSSTSCTIAVLRFYSLMVKISQTRIIYYQEKSHARNTTFLIIAILLVPLQRQCVFGERTKAGCVGLIKKDFVQKANSLIPLSTPEILWYVSLPTGTDYSKLRLPLICQFIHNRDEAVVAFQSLCSHTRCSHPEVSDDRLRVCLPPGVQTPFV